MRIFTTTGLSWLVAALALITAGLGLLWYGQGTPFDFTTLHGETVQIHGRGLYRYDTSFRVPILRGTDAVTLFVAIPALVVAIVLAERGSMRGRLLLTGVLSYFLYNAASRALGVAYNELALVYVVYFSASLFAFLLSYRSVDLRDLAARLHAPLPRLGLAIFLILAGLSVFVWLIDMVPALVQGRAPAGVASYTTEATYVFDLGIVAPAAFLGAVLVMRRAPLGYLIAVTILVLYVLVGVMVVGQSVAQARAGIIPPAGEFIAFVASFVLMSMAAAWLAVRVLRGMEVRPEGAGE